MKVFKKKHMQKQKPTFFNFLLNKVKEAFSYNSSLYNLK